MSKATEDRRKLFIDQVMRFSGLDYFPTHQGGARELVDVLDRFTKGETDSEKAEHARAVVDFWLYNLEANERPTPGELKRLCRSVPPHGNRELPRACAKCSDCDYLIVERNGIEAVSRCVCRRGQALKELDRLRSACTEPSNSPITELRI